MPSLETQNKLPEFAYRRSQRFFRTAASPRGTANFFLSGAAGVGKTYFCESIAAKLQLFGYFDVNRFSADSYGEATLLHNMFVAVSTPAVVRSDSGTDGTWQDLAADLLKALAPDPNSAAPASSKTEAVEMVIPAFAELLVAAGPRLIVLRDAHLLSETAAQELYALLNRLDDLDWGDVYWIIEHRSSNAADNPHWQNLKRESARALTLF